MALSIDTLSFMPVFVAITCVVMLIGRRFVVAGGAAGASAPSLPVAARTISPLMRALGETIPITQAKRETLRKDPLSSGDYRPVAVELFLARRNLGVLSVVVLGAMSVAIGLADGLEWIVALVCGIVTLLVYSIPRLLLGGKASRRLSAIEKAIPDAMDLVAMSIKGGLPLAASVRQVTGRLSGIYPELSKELAIVSRQSESGSAEAAYDGFAERIAIPEIAAWCAMMRQSQKLGGTLCDSLRDYAERIRQDRQSRAERSGNTASLKLLLPVVLFLAPPIGVLLIGPAVIELRDFVNREKGATQAAIDQAQLEDVLPAQLTGVE